jgi:hypothetical protein
LEKGFRALLLAAHQASREQLDRDRVFWVGDQMLLRANELLDAAVIGKLQQVAPGLSRQ